MQANETILGNQSNGSDFETYISRITIMKQVFLIASIGLLLPQWAAAQLTLAEAEKISAETGRTMFVVAGRKT